MKKYVPVVILIIYLMIFIICKVQYHYEFIKRYSSNLEPAITIDSEGKMQVEKDSNGKIAMRAQPVDPIPPRDITRNTIFIVISIIFFIVSIFLNIIYNQKNGGFKNNKLNNYAYIILIIIDIMINLIKIQNEFI